MPDDYFGICVRIPPDPPFQRAQQRSLDPMMRTWLSPTSTRCAKARLWPRWTMAGRRRHASLMR